MTIVYELRTAKVAYATAPDGTTWKFEDFRTVIRRDLEEYTPIELVNVKDGQIKVFDENLSIMQSPPRR